MAGKTAILAVRIITDNKDATKGFDETATASEKFGASMNKLTPAALGVTAAVTGLAVVATGAASELQQATAAVESVFGAYANEVKGFADDAAKNVGLAESEYSQLASVLGAQLKNMGIPMEAVAGQTDELITLGADLAAQFGGSTADAVAALSSLMRGERDPIEKYGVSIKQADIEARKLAQGTADATGAAEKAADTQATLSLLYEQSADSAGTFAEKSDTLAGSQEIANATWKEAAAALGESLLPVMSTFAQMAADLAGWIEENATAVTIFVGVIAALAAGILIVNGAMAAYQAVAVIATAAQWLWNAAMAANPIGLIIIAIGALIAVIVILVANWDTVKQVAADVWGSVIGWIKDVGKWFGDIFAAIGRWWDDLIGGFKHGFDQLFGWIDDALGWFRDLIGMSKKAPSGGGRSSRSVYAVAPTTSAGLYASPTLGAVVTPGATSSRSVGPGINITVNGALDADAVARQIRALLLRDDRRNGRIPMAGGHG